MLFEDAIDFCLGAEAALEEVEKTGGEVGGHHAAPRFGRETANTPSGRSR